MTGLDLTRPHVVTAPFEYADGLWWGARVRAALSSWATWRKKSGTAGGRTGKQRGADSVASSIGSGTSRGGYVRSSGGPQWREAVGSERIIEAGQALLGRGS